MATCKHVCTRMIGARQSGPALFRTRAQVRAHVPWHACTAGGVPVVSLPALEAVLGQSTLAALVVHVTMEQSHLQPGPSSLDQQAEDADVQVAAAFAATETTSNTHGLVSGPIMHMESVHLMTLHNSCHSQCVSMNCLHSHTQCLLLQCCVH